MRSPVIGRQIRQVLLLHANTLNADRFDALAEALVRRGYRFVTLTHALEDPAYCLPDVFVGAPRNSFPPPRRLNGSVRASGFVTRTRS
jgi:hypothetical protein